MKTYFSGLLVVVALLFCDAALAEAESSEESNVPQQQTEEGAAAEQESAVVAPKPAVKKYTKFKQTGAERAKDLDLRHCLELENNTAIADCAGE